MFRLALIAATVFGISAAPAIADEMTMDQPVQAGSLHDGKLDMVAYFTMTDTRVMEVTATFAERAAAYAPQRIVMGLDDGDKVAFAMPGHPESLYHFERRGAELTASVEIIEFTDIAQID